MALPTITADNFSGWAKIVANNFKEDDLQEYINLFLPNYLRQIVGDAAFIDIQNETRQKWDDLVNGVEYVNAEDVRKIHNGFLNSLLYFIYFEFIRDNFNNTQPGLMKQLSELSERAPDLDTLNVARSRYNAAVNLVNATTAEFLEANKEITATVTASVDNLDNTYTLSVANTKYLEAGDVVTIDGTEYPTNAVTADTSILIDAGATGLDFTNDIIAWEPYAEVEFCKLGVSGI